AIGAGILATGGLGAVAIGAALATTGLGAAIGSMMAGPVTGVITTGSPNTFINLLPAAMVGLSTGECVMHAGAPIPVTTGAATVFINGRPAARVSDLMACGANIRTGSLNVLIGGPRQSPVCSALRDEQATFERFRVDAQAASAAYDPPESRTPPDGYRNATDDDLRTLGLKKSMLEHPVDPRTTKPTDFRAAVFINNTTNAPIVAFKGTSSGEDWKTNAAQGLGHHTFYYDQAQKIATNVRDSAGGESAHFTGHSLGGGMASAAASATGLPATTFNPAGLNAKTVPHPVNADIDEIHVKGEVLHGAQSTLPIPEAAATRTWALDPPGFISAATDPRWKVSAAGLLRASLIGAGIGDVLLHFMDNVDASLRQRQRQIQRSLVRNGCL
ncbi:PAAR domain-containing protein, partial [Ameyamaea chiangmaiensis]